MAAAERISRNSLKNVFTIGSRWTLTHCLVGATKKARTVHAATSYGFIMDTEEPSRRQSFLRFEKGDYIMLSTDSRIVTVHNANHVVAAQYERDTTLDGVL